MLRQAISVLTVLTVGLPAWLAAPDPHAPLGPLRYLDPRATTTDGEPWLLADDDAGDGRRVSVLGDLTAASHVAVLVPGATQDLTTFDSPLGPLGHARSLHAELLRQAPTASVAVVAWLGYDAPEGIDREVVLSRRAAAGVPDLLRLASLLPAHAAVTWVCHSYGTVLCGRASPDGEPDDLVLLASPGTDAASAAELGADRVWAATAPGDAIRLTPHVRLGGLGHGPDPTDASFGATALDVGPARGHSEYLAPEGTLVVDVARIVLGLPLDAPAQERTTRAAGGHRG